MKTLWSVPFLFGTLGVMLSEGTLHAQNLGLEGGTGVFVTPLAYTVASPKDNVGKPVVGFHFVDADNVVGTFSKFSVTVGAFDRLEFGYTRDVHTTGDQSDIEPAVARRLQHRAWEGEHRAREHRKAQLDSCAIHRLRATHPGSERWRRNYRSGYQQSTMCTSWQPRPSRTSNGFSRSSSAEECAGTNAQLWGMAGNAERYQARAFGAAAVQLKGPFGSTVVLGSEVAQQPRHPEHLSSAVIPTTITLRGAYCSVRRTQIQPRLRRGANRQSHHARCRAEGTPSVRDGDFIWLLGRTFSARSGPAASF